MASQTEERPSGYEATPLLPNAKLGIWLFIVPITMMFVGFTGAYLVRSRMADWKPIDMPGILWFNTAVLLLSSYTLQWSLNCIRRDYRVRLKQGLALTALLGTLFLIGQLLAWRQLMQAGIYAKTNPHSSFFYLLTGVHGAHLFGGLLFLFYVLWQALRNQYTAKRHMPVDVCATYWHFLDGLWVYLFVLMFILKTA